MVRAFIRYQKAKKIAEKLGNPRPHGRGSSTVNTGRALAVRPGVIDPIVVRSLLFHGGRLQPVIAAHTAWATSEVVAGVPFGFKSAVRRPESSTLPIALSTTRASFASPNV